MLINLPSVSWSVKLFLPFKYLYVTTSTDRVTGRTVSRRLLPAKARVRCHARQFRVKCMVGNVTVGQIRVILAYIAYKDSLSTSQKTQNACIIISQAV